MAIDTTNINANLNTIADHIESIVAEAEEPAIQKAAQEARDYVLDIQENLDALLAEAIENKLKNLLDD